MFASSLLTVIFGRPARFGGQIRDDFDRKARSSIDFGWAAANT
jgi:hypothetical protein